MRMESIRQWRSKRRKVSYNWTAQARARAATQTNVVILRGVLPLGASCVLPPRGPHSTFHFATISVLIPPSEFRLRSFDMGTSVYAVAPVFQDLRPAEAYLQIGDMLTGLETVVNGLFNRIQDRFVLDVTFLFLLLLCWHAKLKVNVGIALLTFFHPCTSVCALMISIFTSRWSCPALLVLALCCLLMCIALQAEDRAFPPRRPLCPRSAFLCKGADTQDVALESSHCGAVSGHLPGSAAISVRKWILFL